MQHHIVFRRMRICKLKLKNLVNPLNPVKNELKYYKNTELCYALESTLGGNHFCIPFDDQSQVRVRMETIAVFEILQMVNAKKPGKVDAIRFLSQISYEQRGRWSPKTGQCDKL